MAYGETETRLNGLIVLVFLYRHTIAASPAKRLYKRRIPRHSQNNCFMWQCFCRLWFPGNAQLTLDGVNAVHA